MNKKVLILSSSPRKGGNSETLAAAFANGALEAGNLVETVHLREKNYGFCRGCLACQKLGHCVIRDDAVEVTAKMHDADVLVFATPVYYYSVSGQLKTMLDRANPLYDTDYAFTKAYLLATAAASSKPSSKNRTARSTRLSATTATFRMTTAPLPEKTSSPTSVISSTSWTASALLTTSTIWATVVCAVLANSCRTSSASA